MAANVVFQTAFIGDLLLSIPLLKNVGHYYPRHKLILVCRYGFGELFERLGLVDVAIDLDKKKKRSVNFALETLNSYELDNVYCPHESIRTALIMKKIQAGRKVGFYQWWNKFAFNYRVKRPMRLPDALRQLSLLARVHPEVYDEYKLIRKHPDFVNMADQEDILSFPGSKEMPEWLSMSVADQVHMDDAAESLLDWSKPVVFFAPGSVWRTKRWTIEGFIALGRRLMREDNHVAIVGAPGEEKICNMISKEIKGSTNLVGRTDLYQMFQLFKWGKALICNDSGAMHMASCVDLPTVSIFGPTTLSLGYRPWSKTAAVVQTPLSCRPCGKHGSNHCPIKTHDCMNNIHYEQVYKAYQHVVS